MGVRCLGGVTSLKILTTPEEQLVKSAHLGKLCQSLTPNPERLHPLVATAPTQMGTLSEVPLTVGRGVPGGPQC